MKEKLNTKSIVFAGLLIAMEIILSRFVQIPIPYFELSKDRISLGFLPIAVAGMLYGPFGGGLIAGLADILRAVLLPQGGAINPLFTLTALSRGVLYGVAFRGGTNKKRVLIVSLMILFFINLGANSWVTAFSYGGTCWARVYTKLIPAIVNFVLQCTILMPSLPKIERRLHPHV